MRTNRIWYTALGVGLLPLSAMGEDAKPTTIPPVHSAPIVRPAAVYHAPFGYFQTHWRPFPTPALVPALPAPAEVPPSAVITPLVHESPEAPVKAPEKAPDKAPTGTRVSRETTAARPVSHVEPRPVHETVPVPHPASIAAKAKTNARPDRGFATLRSPTMESQPLPSTATPIPAPPIPPPPSVTIPAPEPGVRSTRDDDGVVRPAWPVLPPRK